MCILWEEGRMIVNVWERERERERKKERDDNFFSRANRRESISPSISCFVSATSPPHLGSFVPYCCCWSSSSLSLLLLLLSTLQQLQKNSSGSCWPSSTTTTTSTGPRQNPAKTNIIHHQLRKENLSNILKAGTGNRPLIAGALWKKEVKSFISIALPPVAKMELFGRRRWTNGLAQQTNHECAELYFWLVINTTAYHLGRYRLHLFLLKSSMDVAKLTWSSVWSDWAIFEWTRQQKIFT